MLDAVDHLDALVERRAGVRVEREPDAFHRRDRDDVVHVAADLAVVDERRLRDVVRPLVAGDQLPPPLELPGLQVDRDQRVGARVRARAERREVERRRRAGAEVERVRRRVDRDRRPDGAAADDAALRAPALLLRRDRPDRVRPGRAQVGRPGHHVAADAVLGAGGAGDHAVVRADRRARLGVAVVRAGAGHGLRRSRRGRAARRSSGSACSGACRASAGRARRRSRRGRGSRRSRSS